MWRARPAAQACPAPAFLLYSIRSQPSEQAPAWGKEATLNPTQDRCRKQIAAIIESYRALSGPARTGITEAGVVHQFLDPLFEALGWPVRDPARWKYELHTEAGRPDITLIPEAGGNIFVEAKRFGVIKDLQQARQTMGSIVTPGQLSLPGMATDRTPEEQQAINYAFSNDATWAVLTNFEKLRLFNARRDWLVLSFEWHGAYLDEFDLLWQLSYESVCQGGLDALSNQRHRGDVDTDYLSFISEWRERLAQDLLRRRADNPWAIGPDGRINLDDLRAVVQRVLDRLVLIRFAEDHLIVPAGTLYGLNEVARTNPYTFSLTEFFQRFYRRFDEYHNSALFAPHLADRAVFGDEVLSDLIQKLYQARYRALSPDIMGNTYEQYLGKTLIQAGGQVLTADNLETRKKQGSYYTPQVVVRHLVDASLGRTLYGTADGRPPRPEGAPAGVARKTSAEIRGLRLLDPACGSGSFLIYAYEVLAEFYQGEVHRLEEEVAARTQALARQGMAPIDIRIELSPLTAELGHIQDYPRLILETHLYGVDLDPQAAEIATVNLLMRAMAGRGRGRRRLPLILNQNIKVGNSLVGAGPSDPRYAAHAADLAELRRLRLQLAAADGPGHETVDPAVETISARLRSALDAGLAPHFPDPAAHRPFHWAVEFPEAFVDEQGRPLGERAGFDVVVGNPPWEVVKPDLREFYARFDPDVESRLTRREVEARIAQLDAQDPGREAAWQAQKARIEAEAAYFGRAGEYTSQGVGDRATHKLFLERAYRLLEREGRLGFVVPSGLYSDLGTKDLRQMLLDEGRIESLFSFSNERFFFPDVDHRFKFVLLSAQRGVHSDGFWAAFRFNPRVAVAPADLPAFLADPRNLVYVRRESLARFSPDSLSVMEFQTQRDADVCGRVYGDWPLIGAEVEGRWSIRLNREFDMTNDRHLFSTVPGPITVYNGRMIHQFDTSFAPPDFWVADDRVAEIRAETARQITGYRLGYRRIARTTDYRTLIAAVVPPATICDTVAVIRSAEQSPESSLLFVCGLFNSLCLDYVLRLKMATTVNMFYVYQLPLPRLTAGNPFFDAIVPRAARLTCTAPEFAGLWQAAIGSAWEPACGATDPAERRRLRDELDALAAHLYGLSREEFAHILGTFPLVFPADADGHARKQALLGVYDRLAGTVQGWSRER